MDFGDLFSRAWQIVWHNKFMLLLGFLAALGSGGGSGGSSNFRTSGSSPQFGQELNQIWAQYSGLIIGLGCVLLILGIVLWLVRLVAQAGMISAASRIEAGENVTLSEAFAAGTSRLGPMAGLSLVLYGPLTLLGVIGVVLGVATFASSVAADGGQSVDGLFGILGAFAFVIACLACLVVPIYLVITFVYPFAQRGVVLQERGVIDGIRHGWQVLRANLGDILLLGLFFGVIGFVFGFVIIIAILPLAAVIFVPLAFSVAGTGTLNAGFIIWGVGGVVCLGVVGAVVKSILVSFRSTATTLAYEQFVGKMGAVEP